VWRCLGAIDAILWGVLHGCGAVHAAAAAAGASAQPPQQLGRIHAPAPFLRRALRPLSALRGLLAGCLSAGVATACLHALAPALLLIHRHRGHVGDADIGAGLAEAASETLACQLRPLFQQASEAEGSSPVAGTPASASATVLAGVAAELLRVSGVQADADAADTRSVMSRLRAAVAALKSRLENAAAGRL